MPWLCDSNINLNSSFAFNQTSNIFYLKILHALFSASKLFYHQALYYCHTYLLCIDSNTIYLRTNLNTTSYTLALTLSRKKVLHVL